MTDHTNAYPDLVNVEDWLNAKGYTGEAGACHAAMSLIRKQEARIALQEKQMGEFAERSENDKTVLRARIAELEAVLKPFADAVVNGRVDLTLLENDDFIRAARAALEKKNG